MKRLLLQRRALRDLTDACAYYQKEAPQMVGDFALTVDTELLHLRRNAATGSLRYGQQLGITGLRSWPIKRFPYVIFYTTYADRIVVLRVLHQSSDIPSHFEP